MNLHDDDKVRTVESPRMSPGSDSPGGSAYGSIGDKARSDIAGAAEAAKAEARRIAAMQKNAGADRLGEMAGAVHGAARSLEAGMPQMATYVHDAAVRLEGAANTLRDRNVEEIVDDVTAFARAQPALFIGGAMLAGFALTRFLKSSSEQQPPGSQSGSASGSRRPASAAGFMQPVSSGMSPSSSMSGTGQPASGQPASSPSSSQPASASTSQPKSSTTEFKKIWGH